MPRKEHAREYVRAYHRAGAILRERYLDEWNAIRVKLLEDILDGLEPDKLPPGPKKGDSVARSRHERRMKHYDEIAREHQELKDALVISTSLLEELLGSKRTNAVRKEANEQIKVNNKLIEETQGL